MSERNVEQWSRRIQFLQWAERLAAGPWSEVEKAGRIAPDAVDFRDPRPQREMQDFAAGPETLVR